MKNQKNRVGRMKNSVKSSINENFNKDNKESNQNKAEINMNNTCDMSNCLLQNEENQMTIEERKKRLVAKLKTEKPKELFVEMTNKLLNITDYILYINCLGLNSISSRNENDGFVFFGCVNKDSAPKEKNDFLMKLTGNDKEINDEVEIDDRSNGRHFQIWYRLSDDKYYIRDLGKGFGAFMKIPSEFYLKSDVLINIGDSYIVVCIGDEDEKSDPNGNDSVNITDVYLNLTLKVFSGNVKYQPM